LVTPGFTEHLCFFEQLLNRHLFPINRAWLRERNGLDRRNRGWHRSAGNWLFSDWRWSQSTGSLRFFKLLTQNEATLMTKADLWKAMVVILSDVEHMLADAAGQLFNRAAVAVWNKRRDIHNVAIP